MAMKIKRILRSTMKGKNDKNNDTKKGFNNSNDINSNNYSSINKRKRRKCYAKKKESPTQKDSLNYPIQKISGGNY